MYKGYSYTLVKDRRRPNAIKQRWGCIMQYKMCKAKLHVVDSKIVRSIGTHNHPSK